MLLDRPPQPNVERNATAIKYCPFRESTSKTRLHPEIMRSAFSARPKNYDTSLPVLCIDTVLQVPDLSTTVCKVPQLRAPGQVVRGRCRAQKVGQRRLRRSLPFAGLSAPRAVEPGLLTAPLRYLAASTHTFEESEARPPKTFKKSAHAKKTADQSSLKHHDATPQRRCDDRNLVVA